MELSKNQNQQSLTNALMKEYAPFLQICWPMAPYYASYVVSYIWYGYVDFCSRVYVYDYYFYVGNGPTNY